jgi:hypothetical protein
VGVDGGRARVHPCGQVWGHNGIVPGYGAESYVVGARNVTIATTLTFYGSDPNAVHPIDAAKGEFVGAALCGSGPTLRVPRDAAPAMSR